MGLDQKPDFLDNENRTDESYLSLKKYVQQNIVKML